MDLEMIQISKFILNMKFYYSIILELDHSPEEFFEIARKKNEALTRVLKDSESDKSDDDNDDDEN